MIGRFEIALDHLAAMIRAEDGEGLRQQFARARALREAVGQGKGTSHRTSSGE
jgi:prephenate dehydrogenase